MKKAQEEDSTIQKVLQVVRGGEMPKKAERKLMSKSEKALLNQLKRLELNQDGVLVRKTEHRVQLVLPEKFKKLVYEELHEKMGHLGAERVVQLASERFYWPYQSQEIHHYVEKVCQCIKRKKPNREQRAPLVNIKTTEPFEMVQIDFLHLDRSSGGYEYLMVVVDHFTRFVQAYPTRNKKGRTAADKIFNDFVLRFGFPRKLHHDQGGEFENDLFTRLHELSGVNASRTTPYHPQGDGTVERMNRTILNMLKTLPDNYKSKWKDHINKLTFAYNCTRNDATTFSPFFLLFGRSPRLPIDFMFNVQETEVGRLKKSYQDFVDSWKEAMQEAYTIARHCSNKNAQRGKTGYDRKLFGACLNVGDRVLVRNLSERGGTGKLRSYWENDVYIVVSKKNEVPVYTVRKEKDKVEGKTRVVHRNLLFPCDHLPIESVNVKPKCSRTRKELKKVQERRKEDTSDSDDEEEQMRKLHIAAEELMTLYDDDDVRQDEEMSDIERDIEDDQIEMVSDADVGDDQIEMVDDSEGDGIESENEEENSSDIVGRRGNLKRTQRRVNLQVTTILKR